MDNLLVIRLRAINIELKHDRGYKITLGKDLFGKWYVTITFGRYGTGGTSKTKLFEELQETHAYINNKLRRRLSSPKRIGCPYQIVSLDSAEETLAAMDTRVIEQFSWFDKSPGLLLHQQS
jgi:predicted DNA-binding WGR domain protein